MYTRGQKESLSTSPISTHKKNNVSEISHSFSIQPEPEIHLAQDPEKTSYSRDAADVLSENVMRSLKTSEPETTPTAPEVTPTPQLPTPSIQSKETSIQQQCADCAEEQQEPSENEEKSFDEISSIQTKLTVGAPGDKYEQEADSMAAQVMSMSNPSPQLQRVPEEENPIQMWSLAQSITPVVHRQVNEQVQMQQLVQRAFQQTESQSSEDLESRLNGSKGGGSPLSQEVRSFMEPRFGADFSAVRVHTGGEAVQMNRELGAQAFAHGSDIYFGAGKSPGNNELTAHELTHVVQQTGKFQAQSSTSRPNIFKQLVTHFAPQGLVQMSRTPEEEASLIRDTIRAIAANESGGAAQASPSRMGTSAGIPASYASSTQMIASHAVGVLREHSAFAEEHGVRSQDLRQADRIMHASQRIWEAIVIRGQNLHELNQADLDLTGFTIDELTRMMRFGEVRRLLLANRERFNDVTAIVEARLNEQATRVEQQIQNTGREEASTRESSIESPNDLAEQALGMLTQRQRQPVEIIISFSYPAQWERWTEARRSRWLNSQRAAVRRARNKIEEVALKASEAFLAYELSGNEHIQSLNLRQSDIRAYIHEGRFNRFPEDKAAWNRIALGHNVMPASSGSAEPTRTYDAAIAEATEAEGGWALSRVEYEAWIRDWISSHPAASDEQVVRAAAAHNGHSSNYPDRIWGHFQRLRRQ